MTALAVPADFAYMDILDQNPPPVPAGRRPMDPGKRAKIWAPFAALNGFGSAIQRKSTVYVERRFLSDEEKEHLFRILGRLQKLTIHTPAARKNHVRVQVEYFVPCTDTQRIGWQYLGTYEQSTGVVRKVSDGMLHLDTVSVIIDNIRSLVIL